MQGYAHQNKLEDQGQNSGLSHFFVTAWSWVITFSSLRSLKALEAKHYMLIFFIFFFYGALQFCLRFSFIMLLIIHISKAYI